MKLSNIISSLLTCCAVLAFDTGELQAQTIYRVVGPDGKVTFSDKPPPDAAKATATTASGKAIGTSENLLPYELRQVVNRYPVTLYSAVPCAPCNAGRLLLQGRGIPFTEYTVNTPDDTEALQRISGDDSLPFLTIGGQKIKGYSEDEWIQFLNAANYPAASLLPANYRSPPSKPLVSVQKPAAAPSPADAKTGTEAKTVASRPAPAPATNPSNPTGIKF